jgi:hypothetical protein
MAWNLSFLEENDRKKEISTIASKLKIDFDIQASLREILTDLAQKKSYRSRRAGGLPTVSSLKGCQPFIPSIAMTQKFPSSPSPLASSCS